MENFSADRLRVQGTNESFTNNSTGEMKDGRNQFDEFFWWTDGAVDWLSRWSAYVMLYMVGT